MQQQIPARLTALVNEYFPGWSVEECIGSGSFSRVYRIRQKDGMGSDSALKWVEYSRDSQGVAQILERGASENDLAEYLSLTKTQLQREIQLMDRLRGNSYIVNMDDHQIVDREDGGFDLLIRMEYLTPLPSLIGEMTVQDVRQLGMDICSALIDCEREDIAHRDIKPANIFRNRQGRYKLGDFGVARRGEPRRESTPQGTPLYMAPEVYKSQPFDGKKADIYSLGLVLYELLNAQRPPFTPLYNAPLTAQQEAEAVRQRASGKDLPSPLQGSPAMNMIILRACSFEAEDRYDSAQEMLPELQALNLGQAGQDQLKDPSCLPPPPQTAPHEAGRDERQNSVMTEKSSPSDTNPLPAMGVAEGRTRQRSPQPSDDDGDDGPDTAPNAAGNGFSIGNVINENERARQEKLRKRKIRIIALSAIAAVLVVAAGVILFLLLNGKMSPLAFSQHGTEARVSWSGGSGPWQVTVLRDGQALATQQTRERRVAFQLAPGFDYTIQVGDQTVAAPMSELPGYTGSDVSLQRVKLQYYRVRADGAVGVGTDTDRIEYSPLIGREGERGYQLQLTYKKPGGDAVEARCFLLAEARQDVKAVELAPSEWMQFGYVSLNDTLAAFGGSVTSLRYKVYLGDTLLAQGVCPISKD